MTLTRQHVLEAAYKLSPEEREALTEDLVTGMLPERLSVLETEWLSEVRRRDADVDAGRASTAPAENIIRELRARAPR